MNLRIFAQSLTITEINELSNILWDIKRDYCKQNMKELSEDNKKVLKNEGFISAIKCYRYEHNSSLLEAKLAVETYRENQKYNKVK